jgi:hypothetical protein
LNKFFIKVLRRLFLVAKSICRLTLFHIHKLTKSNLDMLYPPNTNTFKNDVLFQTAVGINLFDGEELLIDSLLSYRPFVHKLYVAYQCLGHYGNEHKDPNLEKTLQHLRDIGLIDELIKFENFEIAKNQLQFAQLTTEKMNLVLSKARDQNCSHFMWVDNDEFFVPKQLNYMIAQTYKVWEPQNNLNSGQAHNFVGACQHVQYYKSPEYRKKVKEGEFIALFFPIDDLSIKFEYGFHCQISISPERKPNIYQYLIFMRFEVEMHHLSFVRHSLKAKAQSQQMSIGKSDPFEIAKRYEYWTFPMCGVWSGGVEFEVARTKSLISIPHFYNDSFAKLGHGEEVNVCW